MKNNIPRIGIFGPSGVGKTTLSENIAKHYNIPFITCSTKPLWERHNISRHSEILQKGSIDPLWGDMFQREVLQYRVNKLTGINSFVTDRTPIDNLAYYLQQNSPFVDEVNVENYTKLCLENLTLFDILIFMPFRKDAILVDDGKRITNRYFQMVMNNLFTLSLDLLESQELSKKPIITIRTWDITTQIRSVNNMIEAFNLRNP